MARKRPQQQPGLSNPTALTNLEMKLQALELRKQGESYGDIARILGLKSPQLAHYHVQTLLNEIVREPAEDLLKLELERLDKLLSVWYPLATTKIPMRDGQGEQIYDDDDKPLYSGHDAALDRVLKILDRRYQLTGLATPQKQAQDDPRQVILAVLKRVVTDASGHVTHEETQTLQVASGAAVDAHDVSSWLPAEEAGETVVVPKTSPQLPPMPPVKGKRPALPAPPGVHEGK